LFAQSKKFIGTEFYKASCGLLWHVETAAVRSKAHFTVQLIGRILITAKRDERQQINKHTSSSLAITTSCATIGWSETNVEIRLLSIVTKTSQ